MTASAFDPFGDNQEDSANAPNAVDGNPATSWSTEHYENFAEKKGVGLAIGLGRDLDVSTVTVDASQPGWSAQIYVSTNDPSQLTTFTDWGNPVASVDDTATASHTFTFDSTKARSVLLWLTKLPTGDDGTQYLQVSEVTVG